MVLSVRPRVGWTAPPPPSPPALSGSLVQPATTSTIIETSASAPRKTCFTLELLVRCGVVPDRRRRSGVELLRPAAVLEDELLGLGDDRRVPVDLVLPDRDVLGDTGAERVDRVLGGLLAVRLGRGE